MKYGVDDKPGPLAMMLYGLQWWVISLPSVVITGLVCARLHYAEAALQTIYLQKLFIVMGGTTILQVLAGHRLPLVIGPASTLLVGLVASSAVGIDAMYTAILIGGGALSIAALSGFFSRLRLFLTPRIVAVILILIAITLSPTILMLLMGKGGESSAHLCFGLGLVAFLVVCNVLLRGMWKSLTVVLGMAAGVVAYGAVFGFPHADSTQLHAAWTLFLPSLDFDLGTLLSFLFCFLALAINELGSIESIGQMLDAKHMEKRIVRGVGMAGVGNMASGALGVIGPVDFSISAGIIAATGCASRFPLIPAGFGLMLCGFFPPVVTVLAAIPGPVMGGLMLYLMASQLATGLTMLVASKGATDFSSGITVALPIMICLLIAFAPREAFSGFPSLLSPIVGNGFVMGSITVIILEHGVFKKK